MCCDKREIYNEQCDDKYCRDLSHNHTDWELFHLKKIMNVRNVLRMFSIRGQFKFLREGRYDSDWERGAPSPDLEHFVLVFYLTLSFN